MPLFYRKLGGNPSGYREQGQNATKTVVFSIKWRFLSHPDPAYNLGMQHPRLVIVKTYGSRAEADLAKGQLEAADIDVMVQADTAGGMREHLAWSGQGFRILVREEDAAAARDVPTLPAGSLGNENGEDSDAGSQTDPDLRPPWRRFT